MCSNISTDTTRSNSPCGKSNSATLAVWISTLRKPRFAASPMMYSFCVRELETPRIREFGYFSAIHKVRDPHPQPNSKTR